MMQESKVIGEDGIHGHQLFRERVAYNTSQ